VFFYVQLLLDLEDLFLRFPLVPLHLTPHLVFLFFFLLLLEDGKGLSVDVHFFHLGDELGLLPLSQFDLVGQIVLLFHIEGEFLILDLYAMAHDLYLLHEELDLVLLLHIAFCPVEAILLVPVNNLSRIQVLTG